MLVTAPAAGFFNTISQHPLQTVGFVEEGMKLIPVLLLAIFIPNLIRTRKDGIVYGALAGMGFNIIEIGLYIANALKDHTWVEAVITHSTRLGVWGFGSHIIWAAFTGMAVGLAAESMKTGWSKWRIVLFVYLVIALAHSAFDSGALGLALLATAFILAVTKYGMDALNNIDIKSGTTQPGILLDAMRYLHYVYNIIFIIVLFIQTRKSFRLENALQVKELSNEKPSIVSRDELVLLKNEEFFFKRKYRDYPKKVGDKIVLYQNLLAMQKHTARQFDIPLEDAYTISQLRKAIINLKSTSI